MNKFTKKKTKILYKTTRNLAMLWDGREKNIYLPYKNVYIGQVKVRLPDVN